MQQKGIEELQECLRVTEEERDSFKEKVDRLEAMMGPFSEVSFSVITKSLVASRASRSDFLVSH